MSSWRELRSQAGEPLQLVLDGASAGCLHRASPRGCAAS